MAADDTAPKQVGVPFQPGVSGNPAGRPKGARNKLGEDFLKALADDFADHGVEAVTKVRTEKPDQYLKVIASLMPKEHRLSFEDQFNEMTDDEIAGRIRQLAASLAPFLADGTGGADEAAASPEGAQLAARIH